jgi:soluble lytic murein transglycosylase
MFFLVLLGSLSPLTKQDTSNQTESLPPLLKSHVLFRSAYAAYQAGDYNKAITAFRQFIVDYPESILLDYAYFYVGMSFMKASQSEAARATLVRLKETYPQSLLLPEVEFLIADSYYFQGEYDTAIQKYLTLKKKKRYQKHRLLPSVYLKLGYCYEQKKQFKDARDIYHQAQLTFISQPIYDLAKNHEKALLTQYPSLQTSITTEELLKDADKLLKSGKANDAVPILTQLSEKKLSVALQQRVLLKLAQAYDVLRENQRALEQYQLFLKKYPSSQSIPYILDRIGRLHLKQQDMASFLKISDHLRVKYPKSRYTAEAIRLKGGELELQGKLKEALAEYRLYMKLFPRNPVIPEILWHIGWVNYRLHQYDTALKTFGQLVRSYPKSSHQEEASYWAGSAAEQLQQYALAGDYYLKTINTNRNSYYGSLSQQALARITQNQPDLKLSQKSRKIKSLDFDKQPGYTKEQAILHRAKAEELAQMNLFSQAAEELSYAIEKDKPDKAKYLELVRLYQQAGDYYHLTRLMRSHFLEWIAHGEETLPKSFWELCYPLSFYQIIEQHISSSELDPLFVVSLILAESVFDPEAYSPAGAMGLMQLMPTTGARMATQIEIPAPSPEQYFRPELNILLGTTYLKELLSLFDRQLLPVIASYNAGEQVVSTWWNDRYKENMPAFVASIPYQETKQYVQKVLWYYWEYQRIYQ